MGLKDSELPKVKISTEPVHKSESEQYGNKSGQQSGGARFQVVPQITIYESPAPHLI
jgi:hypothetical protein